jgi:hypothetical protein
MSLIGFCFELFGEYARQQFSFFLASFVLFGSKAATRVHPAAEQPISPYCT